MVTVGDQNPASIINSGLAESLIPDLGLQEVEAFNQYDHFIIGDRDPGEGSPGWREILNQAADTTTDVQAGQICLQLEHLPDAVMQRAHCRCAVLARRLGRREMEITAEVFVDDRLQQVEAVQHHADSLTLITE